MKRSLIPIAVAVILAISFVSVANIVSNTVISIKNKGYVKVKGFAKKEIKSDLGILKATIVRKSDNLQVCYKGLKEDKENVVGFLTTFGIPQDEVEFSSAEISEKYKVTERIQYSRIRQLQAEPRI